MTRSARAVVVVAVVMLAALSTGGLRHLHVATCDHAGHAHSHGHALGEASSCSAVGGTSERPAAAASSHRGSSCHGCSESHAASTPETPPAPDPVEQDSHEHRDGPTHSHDCVVCHLLAGTSIAILSGAPTVHAPAGAIDARSTTSSSTPTGAWWRVPPARGPPAGC